MKKVFCQSCKRMVASGPYCDNCGASLQEYSTQAQTNRPVHPQETSQRATGHQTHPSGYQQQVKNPSPVGYKILGICVGLLVLIAVIGKLTDKQEPAPPVGTPATSAPSNTPRSATAARTQQATELDKERTKYMRKYFYEGFGGSGNPEFAASWYKHIAEMTVTGDAATVKIDLPADSEGMKLARELCGIILGNSRVEKIHVATVTMLDKSGQTLTTCEWTAGGPKIR